MDFYHFFPDPIEDPLRPGFHGEDEPLNCLCDECDYYLLCFPDWADPI